MKLKVKEFDELDTEEIYDILALRADVFIVEQDSVYQDVDGIDKDSLHIYYEDEGHIVAYLRLIAPGAFYDEYASIGRVISNSRGEGHASALLQEAIDISKEKYPSYNIKIEALEYVTSLYEGLGFEKVSDPYEKDDMMHVEMVLNISKN